MKRIVFILAALLAVSISAWAEDASGTNDFNQVAREAASFFSPISGKISSVKDGTAVIGMGQADKIKKGMRMKVFREEDDFRHPVTGEILGKIEDETGEVEVSSVEEHQSTAGVIRGDVKEGDRVRISQGTLPVLFYQVRSVDWSLGDSLYRAFRTEGRFEVLETAHDSDDVAVMLSDLKQKGAAFGVFVKEKENEGKKTLQVGLYHSDGTLFYSRDLPISAGELKQIRSGYDFLKETDSSQSMYTVPSSTDLITNCPGENSDELIAVSDGNLVVYRADSELEEISSAPLDRYQEALRLDCGEVDEGTPVITVTTIFSGRVSSLVFRKTGDTLKRAYSTEGFLRIVDGKVLYQAYSEDEGFSGRIFALDPGGKWRLGRQENIPRDVNLYDFAPVNYKGKQETLLVDDLGYINLYDENWNMVWRSKEKAGSFLREYKKPSLSGLIDKGKWYGKDRALPFAGSWIMIRRNPVASNAPGLGSSSTDFIGVSVDGDKASESMVLKGLDGTILDFAILNDRLVVLIKPSFFSSAGNLFKGMNPFGRKIYLFPLKKD